MSGPSSHNGHLNQGAAMAGQNSRPREAAQNELEQSCPHILVGETEII